MTQSRQQPRAVFLLGFMGAGKTSVGRALARRLQWRFVDLDHLIENQEGRTIADIFARSGEDSFRRLETAALKNLLSEIDHGPPSVVALGGGASLQAENAAMLAAFGSPQVFLDAPFEVVRRRCLENLATRPLLREDEPARLLYETRRPHYLKAQYRVDTASCTAEQAAADIALVLALEPAGGDR